MCFLFSFFYLFVLFLGHYFSDLSIEYLHQISEEHGRDDLTLGQGRERLPFSEK